MEELTEIMTWCVCVCVNRISVLMALNGKENIKFMTYSLLNLYDNFGL